MPDSVLHPAQPSHFFLAVDRVDEMARLQAQAEKRKSMLVFGPEGVGKTRLLNSFVEAEPLAIYVGQTSSPRELMLTLMDDLRSLAKRDLRLPSGTRSSSTSSLKGIVHRALDRYPFLLVLDHISGPSRVVADIIKELNYYGRTPIFLAARTPHMEDIGALQPLCADRSERTEIKNLPPAIALKFAHIEARRTGLCASNLEGVLESLVDWSDGNPGGLLQMIKLAHLPVYRIGDQIKAHVLYIDYRMGRIPRA